MQRLVALVLAMVSLAGSASAQAVATFDWRMADRFGLDADGDTLVDLPNTRAYAQACRTVSGTELCGEFDVTFDGRSSWIGGKAVGPMTHAWQIRSSAGATQTCRADSLGGTCRVWLREGVYDVSLAVSRGLAGASVASKVPIEDLLLVSIGDSYASGEGTPERMRRIEGTIDGNVALLRHDVQWADDGAGQPVFGSATAWSIESAHRRAHRSTLSAAAQMALDLERKDPHTSVTFVSVAASGATMRTGVLGSYAGVTHEPAISGGNLPPQLAQLKDLVGTRWIDAMTASVGGNDVGFSRAVQDLILLDPAMTGYDAGLEAIGNAIRTGNWTHRVSPVGETDRLDGLEGLDRMYDSLQAAIDGSELRVLNLYITEYPDSTSQKSGNGLVWCDRVFESIVPFGEIDSREFEWVYGAFLSPLNAKVSAAATRNRWVYTPMRQATATRDWRAEPPAHGLCAPKPYEPEAYRGSPSTCAAIGPNGCMPGSVTLDPLADVRWFRNAHEAKIIQGPADDGMSAWVLDNALTKGTLHPNELGNQFVKQRLLASLQLPVDIPALGIADIDDQLSEATSVVTPGSPTTSNLSGFVVPFGDVDMIRVASQSRGTRVRVKVDRLNPLYEPYLRVDPQLRLFDSAGTQLAANDNLGPYDVASSSAVDFALPGFVYAGISSSGNAGYDATRGFSDAKGTTTGQYFVSTSYEVAKDDLVSGATPLALGQALDAYAIERPRDLDLFTFTAVQGQRVRFDAFVLLPVARQLQRREPLFDVQLRLFQGATLVSLANGDLVFTAPTSGTYTLGVSSASSGDYSPLGVNPLPVSNGQTGAYSIEARLE